MKIEIEDIKTCPDSVLREVADILEVEFLVRYIIHQKGDKNEKI